MSTDKRENTTFLTIFGHHEIEKKSCRGNNNDRGDDDDNNNNNKKHKNATKMRQKDAR